MRNYITHLILTLLSASCQQGPERELTVQDIEIFKNTIAWDFIQAVDENDVSKMQNILKQNPELINFQDLIFGTTALIWAVSSEKYQSAKSLLDNGADPNVISKIGTTALFNAISFASNDTQANRDPKFTKLLLDYKANPNINYCAPNTEGETDPIECGTSLLMYSVSRGLRLWIHWRRKSHG